MENWGEILIQLLGYFLIWVATDIKRDEDSKINLFDKYWFIQLILIVFGVLLVSSTIK